MLPEHKFAMKLLAKSGSVGLLTSDQKHRLGLEGFPFLDFMNRKQLDGLYSILSDVRLPITPLYERVWDIQRRNIQDLIGEMNRRNLSITILKGAEYTEALFRSKPLKFRRDTDILVPRSRLMETKELLLQIGYSQSRFDTNAGRLIPIDESRIEAVEKDHYNLVSFAKLERFDLRDYMDVVQERWVYPLLADGEIGTCVLAVDVSCSIDRRMDPGPLFDRAVPSAFPGAQTLSLEDHLWTNMAIYYLDLFGSSSPSLDKLAAIIAMLSARKIDWSIISGVAEQYQLRPSFYYILQFANKLVPDLVPAEVLSELDPRNGIRERDFGWLLPKAFDLVDPFPFDIKPGDLQ